MRKFSLNTEDDESFISAFLPKSSSENNSLLIARLKKAVRKLITEDLTQRQKEYIVLYYLENTKMKDIAKMYDVDISTVSRTVKRARNNIYKYLKYYL